jgi:Xaa-Pro aminopeptidase
VHYRVTRKSNRRIEPGDLLLIDPGAQYEDGTTDVTRTIAIGEPTEEMRDRYTRVLRGHIAIDRAVFPDGVSGAQIDAFARQFLWHAGIDFDHGTGHGVGSYLSVHEGPARISKLGTTPLKRHDPLQRTRLLQDRRLRHPHRKSRTGCRESHRGCGEADERVRGADPRPFDRRLINADRISKQELRWLNAYHARVRDEIRPLVDEATKVWLDAATAPMAYTD